MILGTAGHIDHGKTALVRALTGVDTDRLPEEKRRGITIDLGFAPLRLPDGTTMGVVDVPGHEAFVRTMLAGSSGVDIALLIVAADEGPMPQTREHLAILQILKVREILVALTKSDLVEPDWLALVTEDVRALVAAAGYGGAEIVPTSVVSGAGIEHLRSAIAARARASRNDRAAAAGEERALFRLPVDRSFTVKGTGTVATGTVWSGTLGVDDAVRILPGGEPARVRGLQSHGESLQRLAPGTRAAVALAGVDAAAIARGTTLVVDQHWNASLVLRADLTLLANAPELRARTRVRFHLGTADVGARVVAAGGPVQAGTSRPVRIVLDEPVVARGGDRFVLRSASPLATIGGGVVTDANALRRSRPMAALGLATTERLELMVTESGLHGLAEAGLPARLGVRPGEIDSLARAVGGITRVGDRLYAQGVLEDCASRLVNLVRAHHDAHPLDSGMPRQDARSRLRLEPAVFDHIVAALVAGGRVDAAEANLRLHGRAPALSDAQSKTSDEILAVIADAGAEPPSLTELQERFGAQTRALLRHLERSQQVVQVADDRFYSPQAVRTLLERMEEGMSGRGALAPTDLREMLGFSRKFLIPFLEFCDKRGYTMRQGNGRLWRGSPAHSSKTP